MYTLKQTPEDFIVEEIPNRKFHGNGLYSIYLLKKRGYTTEKAIQTVCRKSGVHRKDVGYAGNKDKNAITSQYISVKKKIHDIDEREISLKFTGCSDEPLSLGDLAGNRFSIITRNIEKLPKKIDFVENYFDSQRFSKNNVDVGRAIIKGDFKKAAEAIEHDSVKEHLKMHPNDHVGAFKTLPYKIQTIYINSYQSYLWNMAAKEYIKKKSKKYISIDFGFGELGFIDQRIENMSIPLISFDTEFTDSVIERTYSGLLEKESISSRDLILRKTPDLTPTGGKRELFAEIKDLTIGSPEDDELNKDKKKIQICFCLPKASYATMAVKKMFL